jgi:hypothetical protein
VRPPRVSWAHCAHVGKPLPALCAATTQARSVREESPGGLIEQSARTRLGQTRSLTADRELHQSGEGTVPFRPQIDASISASVNPAARPVGLT